MIRLIAGIATSVMLCAVAYGQVNDNTQDKLWWDHPKIAIVYGGVSGAEEPIDSLELLRISGITAVVGGVSSEAMIQRAADKGINLIGLGYAWGIPHAIPSCRSAMNDKGQISTAACPFSEPFWDANMRKPVMHMVRRSLEFPNIVGYFVDSEQYAIYPRTPACFCHDCWEKFMKYKGLAGTQVDETERGQWLESPDTPSYEEYIDLVVERLAEQYRELADAAHALNPTFVFGNLPGNPRDWQCAGMARGTATDQAPFFSLLENTYASEPGYGSKPERGGWEPGFVKDRAGFDRMGIPYRILGGSWLTVNTKEKADKRYTRDVFQLYDQGHRLGGHHASDGYWFGPVGQILSQEHFRKNYPGSAIREYWLAVRSINRLLGIEVPDDEGEVLQYLRRIDD